MRMSKRSNWGMAGVTVGCVLLAAGCGDESSNDDDAAEIRSQDADQTASGPDSPERDADSGRSPDSEDDGAVDQEDRTGGSRPRPPRTDSDGQVSPGPGPDDDDDEPSAVNPGDPSTDDDEEPSAPSSDDPPPSSDVPTDGDMAQELDNPLVDPGDGPPAGNLDGQCAIPDEARPADTSTPDQVIGTGTPQSCTADAVIDAVARGGIITFDCGPDPITITLDRPAQIYNDAAEEVVLDGGGLVTLSGGGTTRILYMNTCDESLHFTTTRCDNQDHPRLTVQNITFANGSFKDPIDEEGGGGAIYALGGRLKIVNSRFFNNECTEEGADVAGGAVVAYLQHEERTVYVVNSTFGGAEGYGNSGANGGAIGSIGVSWTIINSVLSYNEAVGYGGNPAQDGTPGGGSGGAIYNDGATMTLSLCGTRIEHNRVRQFGDAIFFISNTHTGTLVVQDSVIQNNDGGEWHLLPGISMHDSTVQIIENSVIED